MYDYLVTEKEIKSQNKSGEVCFSKWWKTKKASSIEEAFVLFLEKNANLIIKELYDFYELLE